MPDADAALVRECAEAAFSGGGIGAGEARRPIDARDDLLPEPAAAADRTTRGFNGDAADAGQLNNIKRNACSEDCAFCSQSALHETDPETRGLPEPAGAARAARRAEGGATSYCLEAARGGRPRMPGSGMPARRSPGWMGAERGPGFAAGTGGPARGTWRPAAQPQPGGGPIKVPRDMLHTRARRRAGGAPRGRGGGPGAARGGMIGTGEARGRGPEPAPEPAGPGPGEAAPNVPAPAGGAPAGAPLPGGGAPRAFAVPRPAPPRSAAIPGGRRAAPGGGGGAGGTTAAGCPAAGGDGPGGDAAAREAGLPAGRG